MKRYFSWDDVDYIVGTTYIEIDDGYATKQIALTPNKYIASNRKDVFDNCILSYSDYQNVSHF